MKKVILLLLFILTTNNFILAQSWKPTYSNNCNLDLSIHGYMNWDANNPWAVANNLFEEGNYKVCYLPMRVEDARREGSTYAYVRTNAARFDFYTDHIVITQLICCPTVNSSGTDIERKLMDLYFKKEINGANTNIGTITSVSFESGRAMVTTSKLKIRVNCDGIMMIKKIPGAAFDIGKINCKLNFYPGYKASSLKIPQNVGKGDSWSMLARSYNKEDISHVFMDEYGGIGFYLLKNEEEYYNATTTYPEVTYDISDVLNNTPGYPFWIAAFPPKTYKYENDYKTNSLPKRSAYASLVNRFVSYQDNYWPGGYKRLYINKWTDSMTDPMNSYFFVNSANDQNFRDAMSGTTPNYVHIQNEGLFIHHDCLTLWKDWLFDYKPRAFSGSDYGILTKIKQNLFTAVPGSKYIVYTSPQYFIKNTHYNGWDNSGNIRQNSPYATSQLLNVSGETITYKPTLANGNINYYLNMAGTDERKIYTFNNGQRVDFGDGAVKQIPIANNWDFMSFDKNSDATGIDHFMKACNYKEPPWVPMNREGENMVDYINAVSQLANTDDDGTNDYVDGIFMDTPYEFNIPRTYQLMRELRTNGLTKRFTLMLHESARAGQDAYLPQIDAYADYIVNGEMNKNFDFYDRKLWRYFISTMNISNTPSLILTPELISVKSQTDGNFAVWCYTNNVKLMYPSIVMKDVADGNIDKSNELVDFFWNNYPNKTNLENMVKSNHAFHQSLLSENYNGTTTGYWYKNPPGGTTFSGSQLLKGDFDNNKKEDLVIINNPSNGLVWNFVSSYALSAPKRILFNPDPNATPISIDLSPFGPTASIPFIGEFNGEGRSDIGYISIEPKEVVVDGTTTIINLDVLHSSFSKTYSIWEGNTIIQSLVFQDNEPQNFSTFHPDKVIIGNFDNDKKDDILFYKYNSNSSQIMLYLNYGMGFNPTSIFPLNFVGIPFAADIDGDNKDEIIIANKSTNGCQWKIYKPILGGTSGLNLDLYEFRSLYFGGAWDIPLVGNFDNSKNADICFSRQDKFNYLLSSGTSFFNSNVVDDLGYTSPIKPFVIDINGDGYDDPAVYYNNQIKIKINKPGSIFNSNLLPKLSSTEEVIPTEFSLSQNYPNPFNPSTTIKFDIPKATRVSLKIYNVLGQEVKTLVNEIMEPGAYNFKWDAGHYASGMYIYKIEAGNFVQSKKMMLIK
ncbi:MAG: T9SS type A sorting domain-containing protein [bacterium]